MVRIPHHAESYHMSCAPDMTAGFGRPATLFYVSCDRYSTVLSRAGTGMAVPPFHHPTVGACFDFTFAFFFFLLTRVTEPSLLAGEGRLSQAGG